jgi:hypothetical protein
MTTNTSAETRGEIWKACLAVISDTVVCCSDPSCHTNIITNFTELAKRFSEIALFGEGSDYDGCENLRRDLNATIPAGLRPRRSRARVDNLAFYLSYSLFSDIAPRP